MGRGEEGQGHFWKVSKRKQFFPEEDIPYWVCLGLNTIQDNPVIKKTQWSFKTQLSADSAMNDYSRLGLS